MMREEEGRSGENEHLVAQGQWLVQGEGREVVDDTMCVWFRGFRADLHVRV